jgi:hypothetical protein
MIHAKNPLFPRTINEQVADLNTKRVYILANNTRFHIPLEELVLMLREIKEVNTAYDMARDKATRSKIDISIRNEAITKSQKTIRKLINFYVVGNPEATPTDYEALNIPKQGYHPPLSLPDYAPKIRRIMTSNLGIDIIIIDSKTGKPTIPEGVKAIEIFIQRDGEPPKEIPKMSEYKMATSARIHLQFDFDDELKIIYLAFRWVGTRGDFGIWSEIYKTAVVR